MVPAFDPSQYLPEQSKEAGVRENGLETDVVTDLFAAPMVMVTAMFWNLSRWTGHHLSHGVLVIIVLESTSWS